MRLITILLILILPVSCNPPPPGEEEPLPPWTTVAMSSRPQPFDLPYEAVAVHQTARYTPPDGKIWPAGIGYTGQTMWGIQDGVTKLYACTIPERTTGDEGEENIILVPETLYHWNLSENEIDEYPLDPPPPDTSWLPIPTALKSRTPSGFTEIYSFAIISAGDESATRAVTIEESDPINLKIIDSISYYGLDGKLRLTNEIDLDNFELSSTNIIVPSDRLGAPVLAVENYYDYFLRMPDGVTRLATNRATIDLINNEIIPFDEAIDETFGADLIGFSKDPGILFFTGESPYDGEEYAFVKSTCCVKAIPALNLSSDIEEEPQLLRITGYMPSVKYEDSAIVFAEYGENTIDESETTHIAALRFENADPLGDDPYIIWHADVPNIFAVCTVIYVGNPARPYLLTLDPTNGDLRIFDPLMGSIRYETNIEIAEFRSGMDLAGFALTHFPSPYHPIAFIHDPNANEIIEIRLEILEDIPGRGIVAID